MNAGQQKNVDEDRAAELLGLSASELRRLSIEAGVGRARTNDSDQRVFTYVELYRLCRSAVHAAG